MINVALIHFNTPELTEAAIKSLWKHGGEKYAVTVLDNSDKRPFTGKMKGVKVIDNTKGQVIDFDKELAKFPDKCWELAHMSNYGSAKHIMSVQKLWELLPEGFILMESDILLKQDIAFLWDEQYAATGKAQWFHGRRKEKDRLLPYLCYMNVPKLVENGAKYYDPHRCWALQPGGVQNAENWYDTGACLLEDIINTKPALVARLYPNLDQYYDHYNGGSWRSNDVDNQKAWLEARRKLWEIPENKNAKIYICTHADFEPVVTNKVYEVVDVRKGGDTRDGVPGAFFSELLAMKRVSERKKLPEIVGFCHYRRYFNFMDAVPELAPIIKKHGAVCLKPFDLGRSMRDQYGTWGNVEDLDIATQIINEKYPAFAPTWNAGLNSHYMHLSTMFIMSREDFKEMLAVMWDVAMEYLQRIGGDIVKRVQDNPEAYHIGEMFDLPHEIRVGGQFAERINSAWMEWKFPNALQLPLKMTAEKIAPNFEEPKPVKKPATKTATKTAKKATTKTKKGK